MSGTTLTPTIIESFPDELLDDHKIVIGVSCGVIGGVGLWLLLLVILGRKLRLPVVLSAMMWLFIVAVAILTWHLTYRTAREAIEAKSELLLRTTGKVLREVRVELSLGYRLAEVFYRQMREGNNPTANMTYPQMQRYMLSLLVGVGSGATSLLAFYWGRSDGIMMGVKPIPGSVMFYQGLHYDSHSFVPLGVACTPRYDIGNATVCQSYNQSGRCGMDTSLDSLCPYSCGAGPRGEYCPPQRGEMPYTLRFYGNYPEVGGDLVFDPSIAHISFYYDPRLRPWYSAREPQWGSPYMFASVDTAGITLSRGVYGESGEWLGTMGVDFSLLSLTTLLRDLPPTENSVLFILSEELYLISTSLPAAGLAREVVPFAVADLVIMPEVYPGSRLRQAMDHMLQACGSADVALNSSVLLHRNGRIIVSFPITINGGLRMVAVLETPYDDLLGPSNRASTRALVAAVGVALVVTVVFALLLVAMMRPILGLAADMDLVAWMKLDMLTDQRPSVLHEVAWMQKSFGVMVANLEEYRQYLPQSMLEDEAIDADDDGVDSIQDKVAMVFTDIKGSTSCWEASPEGMRKGLRVHNSVIRGLIHEMHGYEVKTIGDAFMVSFPKAADAVRFALAVHERLHHAEWPEELLACQLCERTSDGQWAGLRLRIGVHFGDVDVEVNRATLRRDFFGTTVNKAARLEACCVPGAVAVTDEVLAGCDNMADEFKTVSMGKVSLKGLAESPTVTLLLPKSLAGRQPAVEEGVRQKARLNDKVETRRISVGLPYDQMTRTSGKEQREERRPQDRFKERPQRVNMATAARINVTFGESVVESVDDPLSRVNEATRNVLTAIQQQMGNVLTVVGSSVLATWGVQKPTQHVELAMKCAAVLAQSFQNLPDIVSLGLCSGAMLSGTIGGAGQRFVTVIGPSMSMAGLLANGALRFGTTALYTCLSGSPLSQVSAEENIRPVDECRLPGLNDQTVLCEVNVLGLLKTQIKGFQHSAPNESPEWEWSNQYCNAFFRKDTTLIQSKIAEHSGLARILDLLKSGNHLIPTTHELELV